MYKIRVVFNSSGNKSVQVVSYKNGKRFIIKHIGTAHSDEELKKLKHIANDVIQKLLQQGDLFSQEPKHKFVDITQCQFIGSFYTLTYEMLTKIMMEIGVYESLNQILRDLIIMRLVEPTSKLRSIELMESYFGIKRRRQAYYEVTKGCDKLKDEVEKKIIKFVTQEYGFQFNLIFYDVTTLYYEAFEEDELRKKGYSKDHKSQQPQIVIGLVVNEDGFPITYDIFPGNTFEGKTFIPVIEKLIKKYSIQKCTIVADAGMISKEHIKYLDDKGFKYIIGARIQNISEAILSEIEKKMERVNGKTCKIKTSEGNFLICEYLESRYKREKRELEKQIEKAKQIIKEPSKAKKVRFIKNTKNNYELNNELIEKAKKLLGIKGYYTNIEQEIDDKKIIERYHDLYKIEQSFRISKSDLRARPIFHFKEDPIKLHLLICFIALAIAKHIEIKTGYSVRKVITESNKITEGKILNKITGEIIVMRAKTSEFMKEILEKLFGPH